MDCDRKLLGETDKQTDGRWGEGGEGAGGGGGSSIAIGYLRSSFSIVFPIQLRPVLGTF